MDLIRQAVEEARPPTKLLNKLAPDQSTPCSSSAPPPPPIVEPKTTPNDDQASAPDTTIPMEPSAKRTNKLTKASLPDLSFVHPETHETTSTLAIFNRNKETAAKAKARSKQENLPLIASKDEHGFLSVRHGVSCPGLASSVVKKVFFDKTLHKAAIQYAGKHGLTHRLIITGIPSFESPEALWKALECLLGKLLPGAEKVWADLSMCMVAKVPKKKPVAKEKSAKEKSFGNDFVFPTSEAELYVNDAAVASKLCDGTTNGLYTSMSLGFTGVRLDREVATCCDDDDIAHLPHDRHYLRAHPLCIYRFGEKESIRASSFAIKKDSKDLCVITSEVSCGNDDAVPEQQIAFSCEDGVEFKDTAVVVESTDMVVCSDDNNTFGACEDRADDNDFDDRGSEQDYGPPSGMRTPTPIPEWSAENPK